MVLEDAESPELQLLIQRLDETHNQPTSAYSPPAAAARALGNDGLEFWRDNDFKASASTTVLLDALDLHVADTIKLKLNRDAMRVALCPDNRDADTINVQRFAYLVQEREGLLPLLQAYATPSHVPTPVSEPLECLRKILRPVDFGQDLVKHNATYMKGTRKWVFDLLVEWAVLPKDDEHYRAFWLTGSAGLGKSVIAAQFIQRYAEEVSSDRIQIAAYFFCKHDDVTRSSPHHAIATLAFRLAANINAVRDTLLATENLTRHLNDTTSIDDTFEVLLAKPLEAWGKTGNAHPICILIDALDELDACSPSRMQLLQLVGKKLPTLPPFVRIIVTSRSESDIVASLRSLAPLCIERSSKDQLKDLDYYVEKEILSLPSLRALQSMEQEAVKTMIMERADGVFLAARLIRDALVARGAGHLTSALIKEELQGSDNYIYKTFADTLERIKARLKLAHDEGESMSKHHTKTLHNILAVLVVVREPLRAIHLAELCGVEQPLSGSLMEALLSAVSLLFTTQEARGVVEPIHKSVFDFLLNERAGWWQVDVTQGHAVLAQSCWRVLKDSRILARARIVPSKELAANILLTYCLRHGHVHLTHAASSPEAREVWKRSMLAPREEPETETATSEFAMWLLLVSHTMGRKRALVPELHRLAKALNPNQNGALNAEQDGLCHLFRELSPLYGNKWAPGADLSQSAALLRTECSANGALAHSPALDTLAALVGFVPQVLRMPGLLGPGSCLNTLEGHSQHVTSVQFSRDDSRIMSSGSDGMIRLWDAETGEVLCTLETAEQDGVRATDLGADGSCIVSGGCDNMVHVWDVATGEHRHLLKGHEAEITSVVLSPDDGASIVASGSFDKTIRLWDLSTGKLLRTLTGHTDRICSINFSADGKRIASGSHDKTVRIWDVSKALRQLTPEAPRQLSAEAPHQWNAEAPRLLRAETPRLLDVEAPRLLNVEVPQLLDAEAPQLVDAEAPQLVDAEALYSLLNADAGGILSVHFSPDGERIVAGDGSSNVHVWDVTRSEKIHTLIGHTSAVLTVCFNHDGKRIVSGGLDRTLRVWNAASGMLSHVLSGHEIGVCCARFSTNGTRIVSGGQDRVLRVWDAVAAETQYMSGGHDRAVFAVDFSHDGMHIVSGGEDSTVRQWDAETGALIRVIDEGGYFVTSVACSHDGKLIASGDGDQRVRLWDSETGELLRTLEDHKGAVTSVAFSHDDCCLVTASFDKTIRVWSVAMRTPVYTLSGHTAAVNAACFVPRSREQIVSGSHDQTVRLWDVAKGQTLLTLEGHSDWVLSVAVDLNRRIVSGSRDKTVRVWATHILQGHEGSVRFEPQILRGHEDSVRSVHFSPDGSSIVSGSYDTTVRVWNTATGTVLHVLQGHGHRVTSVRFNYNGSRIVSGGSDKIVRVWDIATSEARIVDCPTQRWTKQGFSWWKDDIKLDLELDETLVWSSVNGRTDVPHATLHLGSALARSIEKLVIDNGGYKGGRFAARVEEITIFKNESLITTFNERMSLSHSQREQSVFNTSWSVGLSDTETYMKQEFNKRLEDFFAESDVQAQPRSVKVALMWHGVTSDDVAYSIFRSGLSSRVSISNDQGFFGKGVYLTPEAEYAAFYANKQRQPTAGETYTLILCAACFANAYPVTRGADYARDDANDDIDSCKFSFKFGAHHMPKALKQGHDAHFIPISVAADTNGKPYQAAEEAADIDYHELVVGEESQVLPFAKVLIRVGGESEM